MTTPTNCALSIVSDKKHGMTRSPSMTTKKSSAMSVKIVSWEGKTSLVGQASRLMYAVERYDLIFISGESVVRLAERTFNKQL